MNIVFDSTAFAGVADVVRGRTPLSSQDRELMEWIATSYGVSVVAVLADRGRQAPYDGVKRVTVWLDSKAEAESFRTGGNFDRVKQKAIGTRVLADMPERERWTEIVWRAIHAGDEFGAVPREGFQIRLDSEQNFQENYQGSSYYYWH